MLHKCSLLDIQNTSKNVADTTFKQLNIFKNAFSQSKMTQIIANELFTVFTSFLIFLLISSNCFFYKFASNQSQIYQFISPQDFLYLDSVSIHTPCLVIFDHI